VQTDGLNITSYEEKPIFKSLINAGIYVLNPDALNFLVKSNECDMPTFFETLRRENLLTIAFPLHEKWVDIGSPSDWAQAVDEYNSNLGKRV
jgi:NDP-sugar pyrophosphorylase family protein